MPGSATQELLDFAKNHGGRITSKDAKEIWERRGASANAGGVAVAKAAREGLLRRIEKGLYEIVPEGELAASPLTPTGRRKYKRRTSKALAHQSDDPTAIMAQLRQEHTSTASVAVVGELVRSAMQTGQLAERVQGMLQGNGGGAMGELAALLMARMKG